MKNVTSSVVKRSFYLTLFLIFFACNGENTPDCFQNAGDLVRRTVEVPSFTTITVFENINLVIKQGTEQQVEIETGEFLQNEVTAQVDDNRLILRNENGCNFIRDYGLTTVYVTSPNITEIRSSTGLLISSDGILNYPNLNLISESFSNPELETTDGSFDINVNTQNIGITTNGLAYFKLQGATTNFNVLVAAGDSRIEAENLISQNVSINHRGSNDVIVNPQQRISGVIRGTGDVISVNRPLEIEVEELFNGRLIFRD
ncbi:head GIN domain-containing protein [Flagellimonas sp. 2504JD1-5]